MAWCPFAVHKPISKSRHAITPRAIIAHTAVSPASSLYGYFSGVGDDSHFYIDGTGRIEQYVDTSLSAYANRDANDFAISFETWDNGDPEHTPWTPAQVDSIIRLNSWLASVHPTIPRWQITSPYGSGIGWHAMFGAPSAWTKAVGKTCPGAPRIDQMQRVIIPAFVNNTTPIPTVEELMRLAEPRDLPVAATAQRKVFSVEVGKVSEGGNSSVVDDMWLVITSADFGDPNGSTEYSVWAGNDSGVYAGFGAGSSPAAGKLTKNGWAIFVLKPGTRTVTLEWKNNGQAQAGYSFPQKGQ
ncbi:peptidoglycan recognition protein family protein [Amycolatopsis kentuckyensis]|uniref:peptidoglycan recognition protein family protein n=1 Tax=Amycolatopsis kentuckyensis TaxID=218823 RepID=UPI000A38760A|nr:peptidoglycan recognition family protein [Amycolatopsis kentuckyensis]